MISKSNCLLLVTILYGCASENILSKQEMITQSRSDNIVAGVLFDHDLTEKVSYNIRKNGSVVIKFAESISEQDYTKIVKLLRSNPVVISVYAEQSGQEVCGL